MVYTEIILGTNIVCGQSTEILTSNLAIYVLTTKFWKFKLRTWQSYSLCFLCGESRPCLSSVWRRNRSKYNIIFFCIYFD